MLKEGDRAPEFNAQDQKGTKRTLSEYRGKKVILYFYPEDDTPTCTIESCNLRDHYQVLRRRGFTVIGVSPQDVKSHQKFASKYDLPFTLLADPDLKITKSYGCWAPKKLFGYEYMGVLRYTFVIDEAGKIERIFRKVFSRRHADQILDSYQKG